MKNKKAVSVLVGYVLLVVFAILISIGVYAWLKTYIPADTLNCQEGVSFFIKQADFNSSATQQFNITIKNNGRFNLAGYFIHATNSSSQRIATIDLSPYLNEDYGGKIFGNTILFSIMADNSFGPGDEVTHVFNVPPEFGDLDSLEVIPALFQTENNKERFIGCANAKIEQKIGGLCVPQCTGRECGNDGCGGLCGTCDTDFFCDVVGQCISNTCTPAANPCGTFECGTATNGTCGEVNCGIYGGGCQIGSSCDLTTQTCEITCGNSVIDPGETCDDGNNVSMDGCSNTCQTEAGYTCITPGQLCELNCGNGVIDSGETCDDGNNVSTDGCSDTCQIEPGYVCNTPGQLCELSCGNSVIDPGETCDDGNNVSMDGCSTNCQTELGYTCSVAGEPCTLDGASCSAYCGTLGYSASPVQSYCVQNPSGACKAPSVYESGGDQYCATSTGDFCCCGPI